MQIEFITDNNCKPLKIRRKDLCYITCADDYIDLYYKENNELKHVLLRLTLKLAAEILQDLPEFKRCHRSFIVNLLQTKNIVSSHNGYKLSLIDISKKIPVSRNCKKEISSFLNAG